MRILTRYVLFDLLKVFLVSLAGMTVFFLLFGLMRVAILEGLGLKQIALLIPFVLPEALRIAVPATILFAACSVFGRMASGNEVVAVKASGISPWVLLLPAFVLAFFVSLIAVWLNDVAVSWGRDGMTRVVIEAVEEIAYSRLQQQNSYSSKRFSITVDAVEGKQLIHPTINLQTGGDDSTTSIECEKATMTSDLLDNTLTLTCIDSIFEHRGARVTIPGPYQCVIPLDEASRKGGGTRSPSDLPMHALPDEQQQQQKRIESLELKLATNAAYQMIGGDFARLTDSSWAKDHQQLSDARQRLARLEMEPYRRWANGFSCLCFVVLGAPLAIRMRNAEFWTSFFMCFLPILVFYYPLMAFGVSQAKTGGFPSWGVWAGNIILVAAGMYFIRQVNRH